ncbi:MAG: Ig-like domain-containing protein, partial [Bacteroidota bacterium]
MKNNKIFFAVLLLVIFTGCHSDKKPVTPAAGFGKYVQAFTSGTISVESSVTVHLAKPVTHSNFDTGDLFRFSPAIKGKTEITGDRIIEFRPAEQLQPGTVYTARFSLSELLDVESEFKEMTFRFSTIDQSISVSFDGLKNYDAGPFDKMQFSGYILTADVADPVKTEKILQAEFESKNIPVNWTHDTDRRKHFFTVDSLQRFRD